MSKNLGESIKAKILKKANETGRRNEFLINQYFYERFLYRIGKSKYKNKLFLKGGLLLITYDTSDKMRPTKDLDFSVKNFPITEKSVIKMVGEIISLDYHKDGVNFDESTLELKPITEWADYEGWRVSIRAYFLDTKTNSTLTVDIATGDVIFPEPVELIYPALLENEEAIVMAYSSESVVAEKFQAILRLGAANSRMKDFYDIFHIAGCKTFELFVLKDAVEKTLENRETELPENLEAFFRIIRSSDELKDFWKGFIRRINKPEYESFDFIIDKIEKFLIPLFTCEDNRQWNNEKWLWE